MDIGERARELFGGRYCAETVLSVLAEQQGIDSPLIPRIATGLCSGAARTCGPCGAVTGALLGLSLAFGRPVPEADEDHEQLELCYAHCQEFLSRFEARFGATGCAELTGCDFSVPEGRIRFREEGIVERCRDFVGTAAELAAEIIRSET